MPANEVEFRADPCDVVLEGVRRTCTAGQGCLRFAQGPDPAIGSFMPGFCVELGRCRVLAEEVPERFRCLD